MVLMSGQTDVILVIGTVNKKVSLINDVSEYDFFIPYEGNVTTDLKVGKIVRVGDSLFKGSVHKIMESHYLPKELSAKPHQCRDYIVRLSGEFVESGELLAEKLTSGGLISKKVVAQSEGLVNHDRLDLGFIDIFSELEEYTVDSRVEGEVVRVGHKDGITLRSSAYEIPLFDISSFGRENFQVEDDSIVGVLETLGTGDSVYHKGALEESYHGKIVFAGRFLYPELVEELFERDCLCIVTYSMNYFDLRNLNVPVVVLGGFGQLGINPRIPIIMKKYDDFYVSIDLAKKSMYFIGGSLSRGLHSRKNDGKNSVDFVSNLKVGMLVKSNDVDSFGITGKIEEIQGGGEYVVVKTDNKGRVVMQSETLDVVS